MTVTTSTSRFSFTGSVANAGPFTITGVKTLAATDVAVYWTKASGTAALPIVAGGSTVMPDSGYLTLNTHFTVQNAGTSNDITITWLAAGWTVSSVLKYSDSSDTIVVVRSVPFTQGSNYQNNDTFDAEVLEQSLDRLTMLAQQLDASKDYSFKFITNLSGTPGFDSDADTASTITQSKADRASKFLAFDANGDITTSIATGALIDSTSPASGHVLIHNGTKYVNVAILDSDTMSGASATTVASSESIKAYVDAEILTEDTIAELNDTTITGTPADNEFLAYDNTASKWINQTATEAGLGTAATKDVGIGDTNVLAANAAVANDDFLRVDGTSVEGRTAGEVVSDLSAMTTTSDSTLSAGVDINMSTTGKIAQKGAFMQSPLHQSLLLGI